MNNKIDFDFEKAVFEVKVKYTPGIFETRWKIKNIPKLITRQFKDELWNSLGIDLETIELVGNGAIVDDDE